MATMHPYLNFLGNTEEAFLFYKSVFGGEFATFQRFSDTPHGAELPEADRGKIMHVSLPIAPGYELMGTDALESMGHKLVVGNNTYITINPDSEEDANKIYQGLSAGGTIEMELQKTFWGAYYGSFADKFGVQWMINYTYPQE